MLRSGVSAPAASKADLQFGEVNESVKAYGFHPPPHRQDCAERLAANPGVRGVDFLPPDPDDPRHPIGRHVRTNQRVTQAVPRRPVPRGLGDELHVTVTDAAPATKHVLGSNEARVWCRPGTSEHRVLAIGVLDNLPSPGAAGQAIQAFNVSTPAQTGRSPNCRSRRDAQTDPLLVPVADDLGRESITRRAPPRGAAPRAHCGTAASGRPDLVIVAPGTAGAGRGRVTPELVASRPCPVPGAATGGGTGRRLRAGRHLHLGSAERRDGAAGGRDQAAIGACAADARCAGATDPPPRRDHPAPGRR